MPSQPPIPPLLAPYLAPTPSSSLTLLTSTLGATSNWLVLRFIHAALKDYGRGGGDGRQETRIVLVSWLRDANFWREGGRKLGIDSQRIWVLDALSNDIGINASSLAATEHAIIAAITTPRKAPADSARIILILDGLDFLLAASACPTIQVIDFANALREHVHATVVTTLADSPLIQSPSIPLEISHSAFVMSMAHQARIIMSVRELDSGGAKDVSGVLRISRGGAWLQEEEIENEMTEGQEVLYFMGGDGGVRVFERGA
ncbi:hypothetical protein MMC21_002270 [Puttea exsequens]|nr:hypothetical protein [Puttea exsequens]